MKWLLVLTLFLGGCAGDVWRVDSRFTAGEEAQLQAAADSWADVGAEPQLLVFGEKVTEFDTGRTIVRSGTRAAENAFAAFRDGQTVALHQKGPDYERIVLVPEWMAPHFQRHAAHEFGHVYLGDDHVSDGRALMFWKPEADAPTDVDRRALALRGQP